MLQGKKIIDSTQTIESSAFSFIGCFPGSPYRTEALFKEQTTMDTRENDETGFRKCIFQLACDVGTHIDAPSHWFIKGRDISELSVEELTAPGVVIDVTEKVQENACYTLTVQDLKDWEAKYGKIPSKSFVCMKTGWSERFHDHKLYMGLDDDNKMHYPGFSEELATYLISECDIVGIGIDTASLDAAESGKPRYPVHNIVLGADKYQIENMVLTGVPESDVTFISLPIKVKNAPECEARVIAVVH